MHSASWASTCPQGRPPHATTATWTLMLLQMEPLRAPLAPSQGTFRALERPRACNAMRRGTTGTGAGRSVSYNDVPGAESCKDCKAPNVTLMEGSSACRPCQKGQFAVSTSICSDCMLGAWRLPGAWRCMCILPLTHWLNCRNVLLVGRWCSGRRGCGAVHDVPSQHILLCQSDLVHRLLGRQSVPAWIGGVHHLPCRNICRQDTVPVYAMPSRHLFCVQRGNSMHCL